MAGRLAGKKAIVVGAGQTPGDTIGNGRATAMLFAREGAVVLCVDRDGGRAEETVALIAAEGGEAFALQADVTQAAHCAAIMAAATGRWPRIDILHNNVGVGRGSASEGEEEAWDRILDVNLKGMWLTIRSVLPVMRAQGSGAIVNVSSVAALPGSELLLYGISKAGVNRLTTGIAAANARHGIRCNAILPGLLDTPMAVAGTAAATKQPVEKVRAARNALVPLKGRMGTAWDTAYAALYLASDEAAFVTGALLVVDGGTSVVRRS